MFAPAATVLGGFEDGGEVVGAGGERGGGAAHLFHLSANLCEGALLGVEVGLQRGLVVGEGLLDLSEKRFHLCRDFFGDVRGHSAKDFRSHVSERFAECGQILSVSLSKIREGEGLGFAFGSELVRDGVPRGLGGGGVLEGLFFGGGFGGESGFEGGVALAQLCDEGIGGVGLRGELSVLSSEEVSTEGESCGEQGCDG